MQSLSNHGGTANANEHIITEIEAGLRRLHSEGTVIEIRALGVGPRGITVSGYFNDFSLAANAAFELSERRGAVGVYHTINEINPALLARACNKLVDSLKNTTADHDIVRRTRLFLDFDPQRPAGISATVQERDLAERAATLAAEELAERGFPDPIRQDSGNGSYLLFSLDLPADGETDKLVASFYDGLRAVIGDRIPGVKIDKTAVTRARIIRVPGTWNRKGDSTSDRPHRRSWMLPSIADPDDRPVTAELLERIALFAPPPATKQSSGTGNGTGSRLLVGKWLSDRGYEFTEKALASGWTAYLLARCPHNQEHIKESSAVFQSEDGALGARCHHNSCVGKGWQEFKAAIGPPEGRHWDPPKVDWQEARAKYGTDGTGPRQQTQTQDADSFVPLATIRKVRLDMIEPETLQWLWLDRFAAGKVTLLAGDPGNGKSWLTMGLAATVSRGWLWPDQAPNCEPSNVVILSAEDGIKDTILPRLIKLGADRSKITAFEGIEFQTKKGTQQRTVNLGIDIPPVIEAIKEIGNVKLLIIDPVSSFLGTADQNKNGDVRGALQPLVEMAAATGMAVVMVTHLSKAAARSALSAATGSLAFGALARQAHLVCPDPDDPTGNRRLLLCMKSNICRKPAGLAFEIVDDTVLWHADQVSISADEALRRASGPTSTNDRGKKGEAARALLRSLDLRNCSKPQAEIRQLAEDQGISYDTLHRAFKDMGGVAERGGFGGAVRWRIPESQPDLSAFDEWNQGAATV